MESVRPNPGIREWPECGSDFERDSPNYFSTALLFAKGAINSNRDYRTRHRASRLQSFAGALAEVERWKRMLDGTIMVVSLQWVASAQMKCNPLPPPG
jgi:hypothetical protein